MLRRAAHDLPCARAQLARWALGQRAPGWRAMSAHPAPPPPDGSAEPGAPTPARPPKTTIRHLQQLHAAGTPIAMLTAYDYPTARAVDAAGADICLVGDSLAQVCLGYTSTTQLTLPELLHHLRAAARGNSRALLVADMPFGSYAGSLDDAARAAVRLVQEGRAEAVKLEGGAEAAPIVQRIVGAGVPVMAHVGLLPQRHVALSGYRVQAQSAAGALNVIRDARALEAAGAFACVVEAVPARVGALLTQVLRIPTIGIGAGRGTSGQVLVWDDALGRGAGPKAKFVRAFAEVGREEARGARAYVDAVRGGSFPDDKREGYGMPKEEWARLVETVEREGWARADAKLDAADVGAPKALAEAGA